MAKITNREHIVVTGKCNNKCIFCLNGAINPCHKSTEEIFNRIDKAARENIDRVIFSGGEPTVHPNIANFVEHAKYNGFKTIQLVSNGRKFSDPSFTKKLVEAGMTEITFSVHGHNAQLHDMLTDIPGSFDELVTGIRNAQRFPNLIISVDIALISKNYPFLPEIAKFIVDELEIRRDLNIVGTAPSGRAYENRKNIFPDMKKAAPKIKEAVEWLEKNNIIVWILRTDPKYLTGIEKHREDLPKMIEEIETRCNIFQSKSTTPPCFGEMCEFCGIKLMCEKIVCANKNLEAKTGLERACIYLSKEKEHCEETNKTKEYNWKKTNEARKEIELAARIGFKELFFKGYEPIEHPEFNELVLFANKQNFTCIGTECDGFLFSHEKFAKEGRQNGLKKVIFTLNEIPTPQILNAINNTKKSGIEFEFEITVTNNNLENLQKIFDVIEKFDAKIIFRLVNPLPFIQRYTHLKFGMNIISKGNLVPILTQLPAQLKPILNKNNTKVFVKDVPLCIFKEFPESVIEDCFSLNMETIDFDSESTKGSEPLRVDPVKCGVNFLSKIKIKSQLCDGCAYSFKCSGLFEPYVKWRDFKDIEPVKTNDLENRIQTPPKKSEITVFWKKFKEKKLALIEIFECLKIPEKKELNVSINYKKIINLLAELAKTSSLKDCCPDLEKQIKDLAHAKEKKINIIEIISNFYGVLLDDKYSNLTFEEKTALKELIKEYKSEKYGGTNNKLSKLKAELHKDKNFFFPKENKGFALQECLNGYSTR
ncbi:MAG: radical SAM protein [Candidatus Diapherotrites archaeon]|nr:radical SAM protein [Candidatus Diapherotrites archaeon]